MTSQFARYLRCRRAREGLARRKAQSLLAQVKFHITGDLVISASGCSKLAAHRLTGSLKDLFFDPKVDVLDEILGPRRAEVGMELSLDIRFV